MEPERCGNSAIPFFWKARAAAARMWPSVDVRGTSTSIGGRFGFAESTALDKADLSCRSSLSNPKQSIRVLGLTDTGNALHLRERGVAHACDQDLGEGRRPSTRSKYSCFLSAQS